MFALYPNYPPSIPKVSPEYLLLLYTESQPFLFGKWIGEDCLLYYFLYTFDYFLFF